eukprot:5251419-Alexandrium_andersonii.AAC.1
MWGRVGPWGSALGGWWGKEGKPPDRRCQCLLVGSLRDGKAARLRWCLMGWAPCAFWSVWRQRPAWG